MFVLVGKHRGGVCVCVCCMCNCVYVCPVTDSRAKFRLPHSWVNLLVLLRLILVKLGLQGGGGGYGPSSPSKN